MAEPEAPPEEVRIRRTEVEVPQPVGPPKIMIYTSYVVADLPPSYIVMPKEEWTEEKEAELIRQDVKRRREAKPTLIRL